MKKSIIGITLLTLFLWVGNAWAPPPLPRMPYVDTDCNQSKYYGIGTLCQDSDDGKLYKGTGVAVVEIAAGASTGDVTGPAASVDSEVAIYSGAGGKTLKRASLTGIPYLTSGVLGTSKVTLTQPATGSTLTILDGKTLTINKSITFTSADDTSVTTLPIGAHTLAPTDSPTFTGTITLPAAPFTVGATAVTTTGAQFNYLNAATGTTGTASTNLVFSTSPTLVTPTLGDASATTINKLTFTAPATGSTLTILDGKTLTANNSITLAAGDDLSTLTIPAGGGTLGTAAFTAATAYQPADVDLNSLAGGLTGPIKGLGNGNGYSAAAVADIVGLWTACSGYLKNDGTCDNPSGAGDVTSVGDCASGACLDETSDGGTYVGLYSASGAVRLRNNAGVMEARTAADAGYASMKIGGLTIDTSITGILKSTAGVVAAATAGTDYPGLASANIFTGNNTFGDADTDTLTLRAILGGGNSRAVQITDAIASPTYATTPTSLFVKGPIESLGTIYAAGFESVLTPGNVGFMRMKEDPTNGTNFRAFSVPSALTQDLTFTLPDGNPTANQFFLLGTPSLNISAMSYGTFSTSNFDVTAGTVTIKDQGVTVAKLNGTGTPSSGTYYRGDGSWNTPTAAADTTGGAGAIQFNNAGALLSSTGFNWENTNKTLSMTTNGANPTLQIGDGTYSWNRTPAVGIEGTAEFQGASYFGGLANYIDISNAGVMVLHGTASITGRASTTATSGFNLPAGTAPTSPTDGDIWTTTAGFFARINGVSLQMAPVDAPVFTTSVTLPNTASPTTDAAGKIAIRTGSGAASAIQFYGNAAPGSVAIPAYHIAGPTTIKDPTSASDYPYLYTPYAITIRAVHYLCIGGTSWTGQIQICDANGGTCGDTQAADTTAAAGTTSNVTSFSDATVPASVWMILKTASVSGSPTSITVQVDYTVD